MMFHDWLLSTNSLRGKLCHNILWLSTLQISGQCPNLVTKNLKDTSMKLHWSVKILSRHILFWLLFTFHANIPLAHQQHSVAFPEKIFRDCQRKSPLQVAIKEISFSTTAGISGIKWRLHFQNVFSLLLKKHWTMKWSELYTYIHTYDYFYGPKMIVAWTYLGVLWHAYLFCIYGITRDQKYVGLCII